ncbi:MAG: polysaccharide deacetylase family protein [Candidatus Heimdallarchaeota archaeon]
MRDVFACLTFDLERDVSRMPPTYKGIDEALPLLLDVFKERRVKVTGNLATKIIEERGDILKEFFAQGHEICNHGYMHRLYKQAIRLPLLEYEKILFKQIGSQIDLQIFSGFDPIPFTDKAEVFNMIDVSTDLITDFFGKRPNSFKMPFHSLDWDILSYLDSKDYLVDTSIPYWKYWDWKPPHHPTFHEIVDQDESFKIGDNDRIPLKLLEIPASFDPSPDILDSMEVIHRTLSMLTSRTLGMKRVENLLDRITERTPESNPVILVFKCSIWEFTELGPLGPIELEQNFGSAAIRLLEDFFTLLEDSHKAKYVTLTELREIWEKNHCPDHTS